MPGEKACDNLDPANLPESKVSLTPSKGGAVGPGPRGTSMSTATSGSYSPSPPPTVT
jgi:hypothetical protein